LEKGGNAADAAVAVAAALNVRTDFSNKHSFNHFILLFIVKR